MAKKYYLAYGSNLNVQQMRFRCPDAKPIGIAEIDGYELLFKGSKTGSYLTIEKNPECKVPVAVWEVSERDEHCLDAYEGYPNFYYKTEMEVTVKGRMGIPKKLTAFVYIMHEDRKLGVPSPTYIRTCLTGYRYFGFDDSYLWDAIDKSKEDLA